MNSSESVGNAEDLVPELAFRSPLLMNSSDSALVVIDVQEKLAPHMFQIELIQQNIQMLGQGAELLGIPIVVTEQYPRGLGKTLPELKFGSATFAEKRMFSCRECSPLFSGLSDQGIHKLLIVGIETHVCVAQTALDLLSQGFELWVATDAVSSRKEMDHQAALNRMASCGVTLTTAEAALFEWCETSANPHFKQISELVK